MGTGIVSLLLVAIPFKADWLYWLAVIFFGLNTILFASAFSVSVFRYAVYPEIWTVMIADSVNSLFLGTIRWDLLPSSQLGAQYVFHTGDLGPPPLLGFAG